MAARCDGLAGHPVGISRSGLLVAFAGSLNSYALLLLFGFFLGLAGTTFAVGIPFVNAWFERARRGLRLEFSVPAWAALRCLLFYATAGAKHRLRPDACTYCDRPRSCGQATSPYLIYSDLA